MEIPLKGFVIGVCSTFSLALFAEAGVPIPVSPWFFFWCGLGFMLGGAWNYHQKTVEGQVEFVRKRNNRAYVSVMPVAAEAAVDGDD